MAQLTTGLKTVVPSCILSGLFFFICFIKHQGSDHLLTIDRQDGKEMKKGRKEHPAKLLTKFCPRMRQQVVLWEDRISARNFRCSGGKKGYIPKDIAFPAWFGQLISPYYASLIDRLLQLTVETDEVTWAISKICVAVSIQPPLMIQLLGCYSCTIKHLLLLQQK